MEPSFDGLPTRIAALLLTTAVLILFTTPFLVAVGVDVPVISGWVHGQEAEDEQKWKTEQAQEKERADDAAEEFLAR